MGLFDSSALPSADTVISKIRGAAADGLNALAPSSSNGQGSPGDNLGYYKVLIQAQLPSNQIINIVADGPQEFAFTTSLTYESPYQDIGEGLFSAGTSKLGAAGGAIKSLVHGSGTRMFTQALTAKVWTGASETTISVPLVFQAEENAEKDVLLPLMQLMFLSMPREARAGGLLSGPGPVFDWTAVSSPRPRNPSAYVAGGSSPGGSNSPTPLGALASTLGDFAKKEFKTIVKDGFTSLVSGDASLGGALDTLNQTVVDASNSLKGLVRYPISLQIGQGFRLDNVVVESVQQTQRLQPVGDSYNHSSGINSRVQVDVTFKTFYTLTQRDIVNMLLPLTGGGGAAARSAYDAYLGK